MTLLYIFGIICLVVFSLCIIMVFVVIIDLYLENRKMLKEIRENRKKVINLIDSIDQ